MPVLRPIGVRHLLVNAPHLVRIAQDHVDRLVELSAAIDIAHPVPLHLHAEFLEHLPELAHVILRHVARSAARRRRVAERPADVLPEVRVLALRDLVHRIVIIDAEQVARLHPLLPQACERSHRESARRAARRRARARRRLRVIDDDGARSPRGSAPQASWRLVARRAAISSVQNIGPGVLRRRNLRARKECCADKRQSRRTTGGNTLRLRNRLISRADGGRSTSSCCGGFHARTTTLSTHIHVANLTLLLACASSRRPRRNRRNGRQGQPRICRASVVSDRTFPRHLQLASLLRRLGRRARSLVQVFSEEWFPSKASLRRPASLPLSETLACSGRVTMARAETSTPWMRAVGTWLPST